MSVTGIGLGLLVLVGPRSVHDPPDTHVRRNVEHPGVNARNTEIWGLEGAKVISDPVNWVPLLLFKQVETCIGEREGWKETKVKSH